ncbi:MAG: hypothetical protein F6K47_09455 [Symploca sp. SIO2E6]|nr:hypothetical protein [Symploca sp. SIO2E6]
MNKGKWWKISNSVSCLLVVLIGWMWYYSSHRYKPPENQLTTNTEVEQQLSKYDPEGTKERISTGLFIQSIKFNSSSEVNLTGYIWQAYNKAKYQNTEDQDIPIGVIFPEAVESADNIDPTFAYRDPIDDNREVIVWYFETTLKQSFNYRKYPFDYKTVWIRLWSSDFNRNTILVPMLESYKSTKKDDIFGYDPDIVLDNWNFRGTFFNYRYHSYDTKFGIYEEDADQPTPELYFNLEIERSFLNSFVIYIMPLMVVASLAFGILMMITQDEEQAGKYGIDTNGVVGICSGLFFVVLVSQVQIREQFAGSPIVYVEFFYPLMYLSLLGVSVNSFLVSHPNKGNNLIITWIHYEDNVVSKLLYWPLILGSATIITAVILLPENQRTDSHFQQEQSLLPGTFGLGSNTLSPSLDLNLHNWDAPFWQDKQLAASTTFHHCLTPTTYQIPPTT